MNLERDKILTWWEKYNSIFHELEQYIPNWRDIKKSFDEWKISMHDIRVTIGISYTVFDFFEEYKESIDQNTADFYDFFMIFWIITLNSHINLLEKEKDFTQSLLKIYKNINIYTSVFPKINIDFIKDKLGKKIQESNRKIEVHEYFEKTLLFHWNKYQDYLEQVEMIQQIDAEIGWYLKIQLFSESDLEYKKLEYICKSLIKKAQNTWVSFYQELDEVKEKISEYLQKYPDNDISWINSILKELDIIKTIKEEVDDILSWKREVLTKISEESWIDAYNFYIAMKMNVRIKKWNL